MVIHDNNKLRTQFTESWHIQSYNHQDWEDERNSFVTHLTVYLTEPDTWNTFSRKTTMTQTLSNSTHRNTEPSETTNNSTPVTTMIIPYIKGTYGTIARILQPYDIRLAYKPITSLRHILTNVKDKDQPHDRQGAVYRIKCTDCQVTYIGETGRNL